MRAWGARRALLWSRVDERARRGLKKTQERLDWVPRKSRSIERVARDDCLPNAALSRSVGDEPNFGAALSVCLVWMRCDAMRCAERADLWDLQTRSGVVETRDKLKRCLEVENALSGKLRLKEKSGG
jgi:hypothetical protein